MSPQSPKKKCRTIGVRGVDKAVWLEFRAWAIERGMTAGQAVTLAMKRYIEKHAAEARKSSFRST